jgi:hypothetical protein
MSVDRFKLDDFTRAYIECALWSSSDDNDEPMDANYTVEDIDEQTMRSMVHDCAQFQAENGSVIDAAEVLRVSVYSNRGAAGHDFWLTRCGHGAGFWDGDWAEPAATILDGACKAFGNVELYGGDDGQIYTI